MQHFCQLAYAVSSNFSFLLQCNEFSIYVYVHICTRRSSAQLQQVIGKHNHGHLFLLLDIIMGIPIQAQAIPMNSGDVKARLQQTESDASESDATLQKDDLTSSTVQSSLLRTHTAPASASTSTRRREDKALRKQYPY